MTAKEKRAGAATRGALISQARNTVDKSNPATSRAQLQSVYDGRELLGSLFDFGGCVTALDRDGELIGRAIRMARGDSHVTGRG